MTRTERVTQILIDHRVRHGIRDMHTHCRCGWISNARQDGWHEHIRHQADAIVAATRSSSWGGGRKATAPSDPPPEG